MFIGGAGAARTSQEPAIATSATHWLIKLAKEAVWQLFDLHQRRRIWALRRLSHPPAKPPCRFIDRHGVVVRTHVAGRRRGAIHAVVKFLTD